jgi:hypothetical protein
MRNFSFAFKPTFLIVAFSFFVNEALALDKISKTNSNPYLKKATIIENQEALEDKNIEQKKLDEEPKNNAELGDFGVIKDVVGEDKVIKKKPDSEEDSIFLNKDIFNEKTKEKLRKIIPQIPQIEIKKLKITNRIISDLSLTDHIQNSEAKNEFRDITGALRYYSTIQFNQNFEIYGLAKLARFDNDNDIARRENSDKKGNSRTFENLGINLGELNIKYSKDNSSLIAGKFTTNFGTAWRWNKGIFVHSVAQNYALSEKLGFTAITKYGDLKKTGIYNFSLSLFTNDRKNLDNSLLHRKNSDTKSQAIAGDTRGLSSFTLATDINFEFRKKEKLSYHFAYSKLGINKNATKIALDKLKKQAGFVFGMNYKFPVQKDLDLETILEYAKIKNINGDSAISDQYFTSNFILKYMSNYSLMIGNSNNKNKNRFNSGESLNLSEINLGYEFNKNAIFDKLTTQIGYYQTLTKTMNKTNKDKAYALLIRYYKNF